MKRPPTLANPDLAPVQPPDDRFIPLDPDDLVEALVIDPLIGPACDGWLAEVAESLRDVLHQESHHFERVLGRSYNALNPDNECCLPSEVMIDEAGQRDVFLKRLAHLLDKANYERLGTAQIDLAVRAANSHGLRVKLDPALIEFIEIWVRGRVHLESVRRTVRHPIKGKPIELDAFSRLAVVAQLKDQSHVTIKLFRQIPIADVEALLPHAQVTMNWFDRVKVFGGGAGTIGATAMKILNVVVLSKFIWILGVGFVVLTVRGVLGYRTTKLKRDSQRTQNLYYQNLANNAAVVHRLCASVEAEEVKEAVLAYALCRADPGVDSRETLARSARTYLLSTFGCSVDFDVDDALETLTRLGLWEDRDTFRPMAPRDAAKRLDEHWKHKRSHGYHESQLAGQEHATA